MRNAIGVTFAVVQKLVAGIVRFEPLIFAVILLANLYPVLSVNYFPTVDGPAHLYNAKVISELWLQPDSPLSEYYRFNPSFSPNWSGHALLAVLLMVMSASWAEKVVLLFYLIGFPLGLRYLFRSSKVKNIWLLYLAFPFTYSYLFHYGFYNYHIGLVLYFFAIGLWFRKEGSASIAGFLQQMTLATLISLSHPFVFMLYLTSIAVFNLQSIISLFSTDRINGKKAFRWLIYQFGFLCLGVVFTTMFLISDESFERSVRNIPFNDLIISIKYLMPIKGIEVDAYDVISRSLLVIFSMLVLFAGLDLMKRSMLRTNSGSYNYLRWTLLLILVTVLLFSVPDYFGTAGFISARLMWFFFILLIICTASLKVPRWLSGLAFMVSIIITVWNINHNSVAIRKASNVAAQLVEASKEIDSYSTVLPITNRESKPFVHVVSYIGANRPMIQLYNYEANLSYFPLRWRSTSIPELRFGHLTTGDCANWVNGKNMGGAKQIDYVCLVSEPNIDKVMPCTGNLELNLDEFYDKVYSGADGSVRLYRSRLH